MRLDGDGPAVVAANRFLDHLGVRGFSPAALVELRVRELDQMKRIGDLDAVG